jgi:hypothetical protein
MKKVLLAAVMVLFFNASSQAACDDPLTDGVDYSKCVFSDGQDLKGSYIPNSNLSFTCLNQVNFDKRLFLEKN